MGQSNKSLDSEFDELITRYNDDKNAIKSNMAKLADKFKHPGDVGESTHEFFNYRLYLTDQRDSVRKVMNKFIKEKKGLLKDTVDSYKIGKYTGGMRFTGDLSVVPKNDAERQIYYDDATKTIDYQISFIDSHLTFITDQIFLIDKQIFAFDTIIKFYDKYVTKKT